MVTFKRYGDCRAWIVYSSNFIAWKAVLAGDIEPVLSDYKPPQPNAYAVYPQTRYLSQRTRLLIESLVERFGDMGSEY